MESVIHKDSFDITLSGVRVGNTDVNVCKKAELRYPLHGYNDSVLMAEGNFNNKRYRVVSLEGGIPGVIKELKKHIEHDLVKSKTKKQIIKTIEDLVFEQNLLN